MTQFKKNHFTNGKNHFQLWVENETLDNPWSPDGEPSGAVIQPAPSGDLGYKKVSLEAQNWKQLLFNLLIINHFNFSII